LIKKKKGGWIIIRIIYIYINTRIYIYKYINIYKQTKKKRLKKKKHAIA
jgi:hypothetical protein